MSNGAWVNYNFFNNNPSIHSFQPLCDTRDLWLENLRSPFFNQQADVMHWKRHVYETAVASYLKLLFKILNCKHVKWFFQIFDLQNSCLFSDGKSHRANLDESSLDSREMSGPRQLQEVFGLLLGSLLANRP